MYLPTIQFHPTEAMSPQKFNATPVNGTYFPGSERDGKFLEPVLKPYLIKLYIASHECNWFLEEWKARTNQDEMNALRKYCHLVVKDQVNISDGLLDCVHKGT